MTFSFFRFLLESSLCLLAFSLFYQLFFARLTHFAWMRFYLLASIVLSIILPFVDASFQPLVSLVSAEPGSIPALSWDWDTAQWLNMDDHSKTSTEDSSSNLFSWSIYLLILLYGGGMVYKSCLLVQSLLKIKKLIRHNPKVREDQHWTVYVSEKLPAFSFSNYIFIGKGIDRLHTHELQQVKQHELVHVRQKHTLDLLLLELTAIFFWFNPLMGYLKCRLQEVHEYLADDAVAGRGKQQKTYAHLLIKLSTTDQIYSSCHKLF